MMRMVLRFLVILSIFFVFHFDSYSQFISPVEHNISLSGTFCELRTGHFHEGLDIRRGGGGVEYIRAVMDGVISLISVSSSGYGNMLVIEHSNGLSSLYGHLDHFNPDLEEYIRIYQYANRTFEFQVKNTQIVVHQGDVIGVMGNTGASNGTHLHFEIFNTSTGTKINPMQFDFIQRDNIPPVIQKVKIIGLDSDYNEIGSKSFDAYQKNLESYRLPQDTIRIGASHAGISILTNDNIPGSGFRMGIYKLTLKVEDELKYSIVFDSLKNQYEQNYFAHIDYNQYLTSGQRYHRCFVLPGDDMDIYRACNDRGVINIDSMITAKCEIIIEDYMGNKSFVSFVIAICEDIMTPKEYYFNNYLAMDDSCTIEGTDYKLLFAKETFYKNVRLALDAKDIADPNSYSPIISVSTLNEPFKIPAMLNIRINKLDENISKLTIVKVDNNVFKNIGGKIENGYLQAKISEEGEYQVLLDEKGPNIIPLNFKSNARYVNKFSFTVYDNLTPTINTPIKYNAYIDDQWILMTYDKKNKLMSHTFDRNLSTGDHIFKLIVEDYKGNQSVFERQFSR